MDTTDTIRVVGGGTISAILSIADIDQVVAVVVGLVTIAYLVGCIIKKRLEIVHLREIMHREAEKILREKAEQMLKGD